MREVKKLFPNNEQIKIIEERAIIDKRYSRGAPAPDFTLKDLIGKEVSLSDFKGKYVFVAFIDSAAENLESFSWYSKLLYEKYTNEKIAFLYIFVNDSEQAWRNLISNQEIEAVHLFANQKQSKELYQKYNIKIGKYQITKNSSDMFTNYVSFINREGRFIDCNIYLGHNMDWVAKKISKGE